jgi:hypothetical protein
VVTVDALGQLMDLMRSRGCIQLRDGDVAITLGPAPLPASREHAAPDPDAAAAAVTDTALVAEYQAHLYGAKS